MSIEMRFSAKFVAYCSAAAAGMPASAKNRRQSDEDMATVVAFDPLTSRPPRTTSPTMALRASWAFGLQTFSFSLP